SMKNKIALTIVALGLGLPAMTLNAQDGPRPPRGPRGDGARPVPPLVAALDANHDGVIDESELAAATAALKTLDKNGDGKITMDEIRPPRPNGGPGGGPNGAGPRKARPQPQDPAK